MGKTLDRNSPEGIEARKRSAPLYLLVGDALSRWSDLEGRLVRIGAILLGAKADRGGVVFYHIINFSTWLRIIDDLFAFDGTYPKSHAKWCGMNGPLQNASKARAQIAHRRTTLESPDALTRHTLDTRVESRTAKPMTATELAAFIRKTDDLYKRAVDLQKMMRGPKSSR